MIVPDLGVLKGRFKATWMAGNFARVARHTEQDVEAFVERRHIAPGTRVLDVACGTGNVAIPAARRGGHVTGVDIAPNLIELATLRAAEEGVSVQFDEGDAEELCCGRTRLSCGRASARP